MGARKFDTRITEMLDCDHPILHGGMQWTHLKYLGFASLRLRPEGRRTNLSSCHASIEPSPLNDGTENRGSQLICLTPRSRFSLHLANTLTLKDSPVTVLRSAN